MVPSMGTVMKGVRANMSTVVPGNFFELVPGSGSTQQRGTRAIVDAIDAGDADRAADACVGLLTDQGNLVSSVWDRQQAIVLPVFLALATAIVPLLIAALQSLVSLITDKHRRTGPLTRT